MKTPAEFEPIAVWNGWVKDEDEDGYEGWWQPLANGDRKWHPIRKTSLTDAEAVEVLNRLVEKGYKPLLKYEGDGEWICVISRFHAIAPVYSAYGPAISAAVEEALLKLIAAIEAIPEEV